MGHGTSAQAESRGIRWFVDDLLSPKRSLGLEYGYELLSDHYTNNREILVWGCRCGLSFEKSLSSISQGRKCPHCRPPKRYKKYTISDMHRMIATDRGGFFVSPYYVGTNEKHTWRCGRGHIWDAEPHEVLRGHWCKECYRLKRENTVLDKRIQIEKARRYAESRGGRCLSDWRDYENNTSKLLWGCEEGHTWIATYNSISSNRWCSECHIRAPCKPRKPKGFPKYVFQRLTALINKRKNSKERRRHTLETLKKIAKDRGGECLSTKYVTTHIKYKFKCKKEHIFWTLPGNIKNGIWCPDCIERINEIRCREIFESATGRPFPKMRPKWLRYWGSKPLELDGYNEGLKLAFEYQGEQHYRYVDYFHTTKEQFQRRQKLDWAKRELCKKHGVRLIEIPYTEKNNLEQFILQKLSELGVKTVKTIEEYTEGVEA